MPHSSLLAATCAIGLAGCTPPAGEQEATATAEQSDAASTPEPSPAFSPAPSSYDNTAWRSTAENGALFATYLDGDGTYRDLRNGDPYQTGSWTYGDEGRLCLTPDGENTQGGCWMPRRMSRDDKLVLVNDNQKRIELTRITYEPPAEASDQEESGG